MKHLNYFLFCIILLLAVACQTKLEPTIQATIPAESAETKVATPTLIPTTAPTELAAQPTDAPAGEATAVPTTAVLPTATFLPTLTAEPTAIPVATEQIIPTDMPATAMPTAIPTDLPTAMPTAIPTDLPTAAPTAVPPTSVPTAIPTEMPTTAPTSVPTAIPTEMPTTAPTSVPTAIPTEIPTAVPTSVPTVVPTPASTPAEQLVKSRASQQYFEDGMMIWLEAYDLILVTTYEGTPGWDAPDNFVDGTDIESDPNIVPPAGRFQPTRGFGKVWRENPDIREALGWATEPAPLYTADVQRDSLNRIVFVSLMDGGSIKMNREPAVAWQVATSYTPPVSVEQPTDTPSSVEESITTTPTVADPGDTVNIQWQTNATQQIKLQLQYFALPESYEPFGLGLNTGKVVSEQIVDAKGSTSIQLPQEYPEGALVILQTLEGTEIISKRLGINCLENWFFSSPNNEYPMGRCPSFHFESRALQQKFENGYMIWDEKSNEVLAFQTDSPLVWRDSSYQPSVDPISDPALTPPTGLLQPQAQFGKLWRSDTNIQTALGWAVGEPVAFTHIIQGDAGDPRGHGGDVFYRMVQGVVRQNYAGILYYHPDWNGYANSALPR